MLTRTNRLRWPLQRLRTPGIGVTRGLFGYYKLDDGVGSRAYDSSGRNNSGVYTGTILGTTTPSPIQYYNPFSRSFNGVSDSISTTLTNPTSYSGPYTVCAWVRPATNSAALRLTIFSSISGNSGIVFSLNVGTNIYLAVGDGTSFVVNNNTAGVLTYSIGVWYHVAAVVTTTSYVIYANGVSVGSGIFAATVPILYTSGTPMTIGNQTSTRYFYGFMDDLRMYNRPLSTSEILQIANGIG